MRTIYAIQFQIHPSASESPQDCYEHLFGKIRQWVEGKYQRAWATTLTVPADGTTLSPLTDHSLRGLRRSIGDAELFTLDWTHPADADPSTTWVSNVVLARHGTAVQLAIILRISTTRVVIRPVRFELWRPRLVTDILEHYRVSFDGWMVPRAVERITSSQVQQYVDDVLLNNARALPVVLHSPDTWNGSYAADFDEVFMQVQGFAHVAVLADKWAAFKLTDVVGKSLSCYDGAVRVVWPGFSLADSPFQHKLFLPLAIRAHSQEGLPLGRHLFRLFSTVASYRYIEGAVVRSVRRELSNAEQAHLDNLRDSVRSGHVAKEKLEDELLNALLQIDTLKGERDQLREELEAQKAAWAELEAFEAPAPDAAVAAADGRVEILSVADAVRAAQQHFSATLVFLESAVKLAEDSPFQSPELAFALFETLDALVAKWRKEGNIGASWKEALSDKGFTYKADISQTAKQKKFIGDYQFLYEGKKQVFGEHVTFGKGQDPQNCMSVHWLRDEKQKRIVVARCGKHGANTLT